VSDFELKPLHRNAVPAALEKAKHYRLLNDSRPAESICLDILEVDPGNQEALVILILALSDQLSQGGNDALQKVRRHVARLTDEYARAYYEGIICERRARAVLRQHRPQYRHNAYNWLRQAMECYEKAERIQPPDHDDAILRWNTCVRILQDNSELGPEPEEPPAQHMLE
jgi:hypothetical protein